MSQPELKVPGWWLSAADADKASRANFVARLRDDDWVLACIRGRGGWSLWRMCPGGMHHVAIEADWSHADPSSTASRTNIAGWRGTALIGLTDDHAARIFMLVEHRQHAALDRLCRAYIEENTNG